MTGYDHAATYPSPQYNYVPNLATGQTGGVPGGPDLGGDLRHHIHGWGGQHTHQQYHHTHHHLGGHAMGQQGPGSGDQNSPRGANNGYGSYYDRNGYYIHQQHTSGLDPQTWHDPGIQQRPDSPTMLVQQQYPVAPVNPNLTSSSYSCKMAATLAGSGSGPGGGSGGGSGSSGGGVTPPSPASSQKNDPLSSPHQQAPYSQYPPCPLSQSSHSPSVMYNNNMGGPPPQGVPGGPQGPPHGPPGPHPGVHNTYSLTPEGHAMGGPVSPGSQGGGQNQGAPQAPLPSPLYPWMRSQFGKNTFIVIFSYTVFHKSRSRKVFSKNGSCLDFNLVPLRSESVVLSTVLLSTKKF